MSATVTRAEGAAPAAQPTPEPPGAGPTGHSLVLVGLCVFAFVARAWIALVVPPWQGPDEPRHFEYVWLLVDKRHELLAERRLIRHPEDLPLAFERDVIASMARNHFWEYTNGRTPDTLPSTFFDLWAGSSTELGRTYSPYHFLAAAALLPFEHLDLEGQLRVVRLFSVLLSTLAVPLTYRVVRVVSREQHFAPLVAAAFVATLPMHVYMGGMVNADNLATLLGSLIALLLARAVLIGFTPVRTVAILALLVVGAFAKRSMLGFVPAIAAAAVVALAWRASPRARLVGGALLGLSGLAAVALGLGLGPLAPARAYLVKYFMSEPDQLIRLFDGRLLTPRAGELTLHYVAQFHRSFWGIFGWFSHPLDEWLYQLLAVFGLLCAAGAAVWILRHVRSCQDDDHRRAVVVLLFAGVVLTLVALSVGERLAYFDPRGVPQGRYLFVAIAPIATLYAVGLRMLVPVERIGWRIPTVVVLLAFLTVDLVALVDVLLPKYVLRVFA